ncbi:MAG: DUF4178 domain-containing protein [Deltaproteobacteria bacterium]|nr:DUF4178 domain-containing protein [Deltaproteobacteria bacterium]MCB9487488.1 DUF4178 domain-containing protein [Deltaproteobacteria bacterium]
MSRNVAHESIESGGGLGDRFALGAGRKRPEYKPLDIHCPNCGAGLTVVTERAQTVSCQYCGSLLDLSETELQVVGAKGDDAQWRFALRVGDSFRHKGARYEVIGRLAWVEDGETWDPTRDYLLWNPRRGPLWLSEYAGRYTLSVATHVMPTSDPFVDGDPGDAMETYDNRKWVLEETGRMTLSYVDGALPWKARIGNWVQYAEFADKSGSGEFYEAEKRSKEIEYGIGHRVSPQEMRRCTGKDEKVFPDLGEHLDAAQKMRRFKMAMAAMIAGLIVNAVLFGLVMGKGSLVHEESVAASRLAGEVMTNEFHLRPGVVKVKISAPQLNNDWLALNIGLVRDEMLVHADDVDMEYYHGIEGGESWSEGSHSTTKYWRIDRTADYRIMFQGGGNSGVNETMGRAPSDVGVRIYQGAMVPWWFLASTIFCGALLLLYGVSYASWRGHIEEEDDD